MLVRLSVLEKDTLGRMINSLERLIKCIETRTIVSYDDFELKYCLSETKDVIKLIVMNYCRAVSFNREGLKLIDYIDRVNNYQLVDYRFCKFASKYMAEVYKNPYSFDNYSFSNMLSLWHEYLDGIKSQLESMKDLQKKLRLCYLQKR